MSSKRVVVIGDGVAGTAAAWAASTASANVVVVSSGAGASSLMSGAIDDAPWQSMGEAISPEPIDPDAVAFLGAFEQWHVGDDRMRLATLQGAIRSARGADRALLDLRALRGVRVAVPRLHRLAWDADLLARGWSDSAWAKQNAVGFNAVDCDSLFESIEANATDVDLAEAFDASGMAERITEKLRSACDGCDAIVLGPWLGLRSDGASALREALGKPVGETLSLLAGTAGMRFELASEKLLSAQHVERLTDIVRSIERKGSGFLVHCEGENEPLKGDAVILASGGMVGRGIALASSESKDAGEMPASNSEAFKLSFETEACLELCGRVVERVGSLQGMNLEDCRWPNAAADRSVMERVGVRRDSVQVLDRSGKPIAGMYVAGSASSEFPHTAIASIVSGARAGRAASVGD